MTVSERLRLRLLRSNAASSEIASEASFRNYIERPSCEQLRTCSDVLSVVLSGEGHISHCDRVLRLCNLEQSSCSGEFGCRSFGCHNSAGFHWTFHLHVFQAKVLDSTCQTIQVWKQLQNVNFDGFWTLMDFELWWFDIFDSFSLVQPIRLFELLQKGFWLVYCSVLYERIEYADDTVVRFGIKVFLEN